MAKRKPTKTQQLRKLVQQQVRRMESRGYRIDDAVKEKIKSGKSQTLQSLRKNRYEKLYSSASAEIDSKIVSGTKKRSYERKEVARRAAETRRLNRYVKRRDWLEQIKETSEERESYHDQSYYDEDYEQEWEEQHEEPEWTEADERSYREWQRRQQEREAEEEWERKRRERDRKERRLAELYDEGRIAYDNIYDLIGKYPSPGSKMLSNALSSEISKYCEEKVIQAMGTAPSSFIETAQMIIYYEEESDAIHTALVNFIEVITGVIVNGELAQDIGETMDEMTDFQTF